VDESGKVQAASERPTDWSAPVAPRTVWDRIKDHKVLQWTLAYSAAAYALLHGVEWWATHSIARTSWHES
jgi:hypothetical protein